MDFKKLLALMLVILFCIPMTCIAEGEGTGWHNILLLGEDSRSFDGNGRTDTMMILSINRDESLLKMTSIMRDTWVKYSGMNRSGKINGANVFGGPELAIATVNDSFDMDIEDYVLIGMDDLTELIDMIDGIDIEITEKERVYINENVAGSNLQNAGLVHLDGAQTLLYTRIRFIDSDYVRVVRQQRVMLALANKLQNMDVDVLMPMADDFFNRIETNMSDEELKELAMVGLIIDVDAVEQFRVPVDGTFDSGLFDGVWKIKPNLTKNSVLLKNFIYGE